MSYYCFIPLPQKFIYHIQVPSHMARIHGRPLEAVQAARGPTLCWIDQVIDVAGCTRLRIAAMVNTHDMLHEFALWCVEDMVERIGGSEIVKRSILLKRDWLIGQWRPPQGPHLICLGSEDAARCAKTTQLYVKNRFEAHWQNNALGPTPNLLHKLLARHSQKLAAMIGNLHPVTVRSVVK